MPWQIAEYTPVDLFGHLPPQRVGVRFKDLGQAEAEALASKMNEEKESHLDEKEIEDEHYFVAEPEAADTEI